MRETLTKAEAAARLGVSELTVHRRIKAGLLVATKEPGANGAVRITAASVAALSEGRWTADLISKKEAARRLSVVQRTIDRYIQAGLLTYRKQPGRTGRVGLVAAEVDALLNTREQAGVLGMGIREAARFLDRTTRTVYLLIANGELKRLPAVAGRRELLLDRQSVVDYRKAHPEPGRHERRAEP